MKNFQEERISIKQNIYISEMCISSHVFMWQQTVCKAILNKNTTLFFFLHYTVIIYNKY